MEQSKLKIQKQLN